MEIQGLTLPKIDVNEKELAALDQSAQAVMDIAQRVASSIDDEASCKVAQQWASERMTFVKNLRERSWLAGIRETWHKQHASVCAIIKTYSDPHEIAVRKVVDPAILIFKREEDRKRQAAETQQRAEALKKEEDARLARAQQLAEQGKAAQADALLSRPIVVPTAKVAPVDIKGVRKTWKVKAIENGDLIALIKGIAGGAVPIQAIEVNYSWLNRQAQLMDGHLTYPGAECYQEETLTHGRVA